MTIDFDRRSTAWFRRDAKRGTALCAHRCYRVIAVPSAASAAWLVGPFQADVF
jgi:hypothetical protein